MPTSTRISTECIRRPAFVNPTAHLWKPFQQWVGGSRVPGHSPVDCIVDDDFDRTTDESLVLQGRGCRWFCPAYWSNFELLLAGVRFGGINRVSFLHDSMQSMKIEIWERVVLK